MAEAALVYLLKRSKIVSESVLVSVRRSHEVRFFVADAVCGGDSRCVTAAVFSCVVKWGIYSGFWPDLVFVFALLGAADIKKDQSLNGRWFMKFYGRGKHCEMLPNKALKLAALQFTVLAWFNTGRKNCAPRSAA